MNLTTGYQVSAALGLAQADLPSFGDSPLERLVLSWGGVLLLALLSNLIAKRFLLRGLKAIALKTRSQWDDVLVERQVFDRLSHLAPALVVYVAAPFLLGQDRKSTRLNSSHALISYAVFCLKKKKIK